MMTEKEARKRWCPKGINDSRCIASGCMAWRWAPQEDWVGRINANRELSKMSIGEAAEMTPREGYCGLAGKQEAT